METSRGYAGVFLEPITRSQEPTPLHNICRTLHRSRVCISVRYTKTTAAENIMHALAELEPTGQLANIDFFKLLAE